MALTDAQIANVIFEVGWAGTASSASAVNVASADELLTAISEGKDVKLTNNISLDGPIAITSDATVDLNGQTITATNDTSGDGVFHVTDGTLTINGNGTIDGVDLNMDQSSNPI